MARRERLAQFDRKHDQKAAEEEKPWQADVGRSAEQMQDEIDRLTIENNKELTAKEKAKQLMELRQAHEIRGLRERVWTRTRTCVCCVRNTPWRPGNC